MTDENTELNADKVETPADAAPKTEDTAAKADDTAKAEPDAKPDEAAEADAASEAAKLLAQRKQSARERVQQAVARQREAERQAAEKDRIIAELRSKLKEPDPAQYDDNAKYTADYVKHSMREEDVQRLEREKEAASKESREAIAEAWVTRVNEFKATAKDFDEVAYSAPISESTAMLIAEMDEGPELAYQLGKNHAEARRIDRLPERVKAIELGKIAARLSTPAPVRTTKAPEPIDPVGGRGGKTPSRTPEDLASNMEAYAEARKAQLRR